MIRTVIGTILVLSLSILIGVHPSNAQAAIKGNACAPLSDTLSLAPISHPRVSAKPSLYLPIQNSFFVKQNPVVTLASEKGRGKGFAAVIVETDAITMQVLEPTPTVQITPPEATPTAQETVQVSPSHEGGLSAEKMFAMINSQRASAGLQAFSKDERICSVASSRGPELYNEIMVSGTMHAGFYARNLPYWATENVIHMRTEEEAVTWWMNSPVHRSAILGNYSHACIACFGNSCAMVFTSFEPKQTIPTTL